MREFSFSLCFPGNLLWVFDFCRSSSLCTTNERLEIRLLTSFFSKTPSDRSVSKRGQAATPQCIARPTQRTLRPLLARSADTKLAVFDVLSRYCIHSSNYSLYATLFAFQACGPKKKDALTKAPNLRSWCRQTLGTKGPRGENSVYTTGLLGSQERKQCRLREKGKTDCTFLVITEPTEKYASRPPPNMPITLSPDARNTPVWSLLLCSPFLGRL